MAEKLSKERGNQDCKETKEVKKEESGSVLILDLDFN